MVSVSPQTSIREALGMLDKAGLGILLVVDERGGLAGVITDGDFRRAILKTIPLDGGVLTIAGRTPLVAQAGVSSVEALHLMDHGREFVVNQLPVLDDTGRVVDLILRSDLVSEGGAGFSAVVMAGGFGRRMRPFTDEIPKPMLTVGDKPILERIVEQLHDVGLRRVSITTHYKADVIKTHFGDGRKFGVDMQYVEEDQPLGTAGALALLDRPKEPLLVINGDVLTRVDFRAMLSFHVSHKAHLTVAVRKCDVPVPFGVVECAECEVQRITEKPVYQFLVNAGIYLLEPEALDYIPAGKRFDMTDLIDALLAVRTRRVVSFPILEYWLDIGKPGDYEQAQRDVVGWEQKT